MAPSFKERLQEIRGRIEAACRRARRDPADVTLVGVSKTHPAAALQEAFEGGLRIFGESRVQEAQGKLESLPTETVAGAQWHFIGPLQSNKVRLAAQLFDVIHAVDRLKIARRLDRDARAQGRRLSCFLEINLAHEDSKHGFPPSALDGPLDEAATFEHLEILGLMAIPPAPSGDTLAKRTEEARHWFRRLRQLRDEMIQRDAWTSCPGQLSMGMSGDFETAIEEGATHVRVGTALFGSRP